MENFVGKADKYVKILLFPDIVNYYYPKPTLSSFLSHTFLDGVWAVYPLRFTKTFFALRHYIPLFFVSGLSTLLVIGFFWPVFRWVMLVILGLYFLAMIYFSLQISLREENLSLFPYLVAAFFSRHIVYGLGSIWGVIKLVIN